MLHNLTIDNLMPAKNNVNYSNGKLDISCISRDKFINDVPEKEFDSDVLLKNIKKRRLEIRNTYVKCYNLCCEKILDAENTGLTDLIFKLPETTFIDFNGCKDIDIIDYIAKKLKQNKLDVLIMKNDTIFITWKFIELNFESNFSLKNPR